MRARILTVTLASALLALTSSIQAARAEPAPSEAPGPDVVHRGAQSTPSGSVALSGEAAGRFQLPDDMELLHTSTYADGRTSSRYQQRVHGAAVLGGQLTVLRSAAGTTLTVIGNRAAAITPRNTVRLSAAAARRAVAARIGGRGHWSQQLRIDPATGAFFYDVRSLRRGAAPVRWVDAASGRITRSFDLRRTGEGTGVKDDHKTIATSRVGKGYQLRSADGRLATYDALNDRPGRVLMTDANDQWNLTADWVSPDQRAGVDAQYYQGVVDRFLGDVFDRDSVDDNGHALVANVHVGTDFCNAFWDGSELSFGDGYSARAAKQLGEKCRPLSGALDVVAHEVTHGVVQYTSELFWGPESTSLNEGFADIMGASVEFYAAAHGLDPAAPADWRFGEDAVAWQSKAPGYRSLAEPRLSGGLDHYSELASTPEIHAKGLIAAHAFFLASVGGANAGCTPSTTHPATHSADCGVVVPALGNARATRIFYEAFTALQETAGFCEARNATVAAAGADADAISRAWQAVGLYAGCTTPEPPPPACVDIPAASIPFQSSHPYDDDLNCTWTYDNGTPGFAFHFSLLDVEFDYDFIYVIDGDGNYLAGYTGNFGPDAPLTCIPTSTGSVQLVTDGFVTAEGFVVDAVVPC